MDVEKRSTELLNFFKALGDPTRLKIVGLLAREEQTVEQLAAILDIRPSTVSHHLARLAKAGLVSARAESYYNFYRLETDILHEMSRQLLQGEMLQEVVADVDIDAYDRKVLKNFVGQDGRIKAFPSQFKKMKVILRYVVQVFEPGMRYTEKEVNELLSRFNEDTATLRRELVEQNMMAREGGGGSYWLVEQA